MINRNHVYNILSTVHYAKKKKKKTQYVLTITIINHHNFTWQAAASVSHSASPHF